MSKVNLAGTAPICLHRFLSPSWQRQLLIQLREVLGKHPLVVTYKKNKVLKFKCSELVTEEQIPELLIVLWQEFIQEVGRRYAARKPASARIEYYGAHDLKDLHRSDDPQENLKEPLIGVLLGDSCTFKLGGLRKSDSVVDLFLESGDVVWLDGTRNRLRYTGLGKVLLGSAPAELGCRKGSIFTTMRVTKHDD